MAIPTIVNVGAKSAGTGNVSFSLPASIAADDILVLYAETTIATTVTVNEGYTEVTDSPVTTTSGNDTRLHVYWKRAGASESDPTVTQGGTTDHVCGGIIAIRGCITSGNPWDIAVGSADSANNTTMVCATGTTTVADCLVLFGGSSGTDSNTAQGSAIASAGNLANSALTSLNYQTNNGGGGGVAIAKGEKATAGALGTLEITLTGSGKSGTHTLALKPPVAAVALGTVSNTDTVKYAGGLGAESSTSAYDASTLGAQTNTADYP